MEKVLLSNRPDFPIAEETDYSRGAQVLLDMPRIMIGFAEKAVPPAVATAQAGAVDRAALNLFAQFLQKSRHVLCSRGGVPALELNRLAWPGVGADGERP